MQLVHLYALPRRADGLRAPLRENPENLFQSPCPCERLHDKHVPVYCAVCGLIASVPC